MIRPATRVLAVTAKEFIQLSRDRLTYAMILAVPIVQLLLFGYAINTDPRDLPAVVLDADRSVLSRSVLSAIENTGYFAFVEEARSPAEADQAIETGRAQFAVTIPPDFSRRVVRRDDAQIVVEADASDPTAVGGALGALSGVEMQALARDLAGPLAAADAGGPPFEIVVHRRYNPENITAYNIVPGLLGIVLSMTLVMMTALSLTRERERGTMETLLATPVQPLEVMAGKLAPYVGIGLIQTALILTLARLLFGVPITGGYGALALGVGLFIVGSLSLGFLFSTLARSQLQAMQMSVFYLLPSILLSGFMFPFRGMPEWAQVLGTAIPVTHFLRVVRGALLKGIGFSELMPSLLALVIFVAVVASIAMSRYRTTLD
ncbi:ABC transporter permease [Amorphus orientalis]|uniref:ABC-2 type transport system permease protein n=1 Tax=Amorphus orientalis TaxID=649198 RepID=A0AAE3VS68_9HYPH|nr:ABC transporter permease [Amorphus orientalis]MDQ0317212.1 ABC-2 type transport system permease protein [Amorphus orientalis]